MFRNGWRPLPALNAAKSELSARFYGASQLRKHLNLGTLSSEVAQLMVMDWTPSMVAKTALGMVTTRLVN